VRVFISADMEGVTGVTHPQDVIPGRSQYERFRRFLTADVNAAIEGAARGGATEFLVNEAHDGMRNILLEDLDDRAQLIVGSRKPLSMMQGFEGADVAFFVGYHARAGAEGILSHTFNSPSVVTDVQLNGEPCSEARMNAALVGLCGIPVGLVTGDDLTCAEARSLYAGVRCAQVKTAIDRYVARCLPQRAALARIGEAARGRSAVPETSLPTRRDRPTPLPSSSRPPARPRASCSSRSWSGWTTGASPGPTTITRPPSRCS
jgi:D-amino peptidase